METDQELRVGFWALGSGVPDSSIRLVRAVIGSGLTLDVTGGDLVAIALDGECHSLDKLCPDLVDLLTPKTARESLLGHLAQKAVPAAPWVPLPDLPIPEGSAREAVQKTLRQRDAFNGSEYRWHP